MGQANTLIMRDMLLSQKRGEAGFRCRPIILNGPPGTGKTTWARRFADLIGVPSIAIDATGESAGFSISGLQKGWSHGAPGRPLNLILTTRIANIVDALLPLLEPSSAARWNCPFYQLIFDMSWVTWILTANATASLPEPLLSRCRVVEVDSLKTEGLLGYARLQGARRDLSQPSLDAVLAAIVAFEKARKPVNLRMVGHMLDLAETLQSQPVLH